MNMISFSFSFFFLIASSDAIIAVSCALPNTEETADIRRWIEKNAGRLNRYGDSEGTRYSGGTPLFDEMTGATIPLAEYVLRKHPLRPWVEPQMDFHEQNQIDQWIVKNQLNPYGDPKNTIYSKCGPLLDETTGKRTNGYQRIWRKNPGRPWAIN
jgi:hypothetical protein